MINAASHEEFYKENKQIAKLKKRIKELTNASLCRRMFIQYKNLSEEYRQYLLEQNMSETDEHYQIEMSNELKKLLQIDPFMRTIFDRAFVENHSYVELLEKMILVSADVRQKQTECRIDQAKNMPFPSHFNDGNINMTNFSESDKKLKALVSEFIGFLETEEHTDSGKSFKPNNIYSCRALDSGRMNEILLELKEIVAIRD